ncbi:hypothetical protein HOO65_090163 [Ceratocystis lukuohia]|uniref:Tim44-like domain-containing protein n=1 Tax=Ceratocystis lukuohia TaxID=2019550 RepID=A0ABR4M9F2_9PEZI
MASRFGPLLVARPAFAGSRATVATVLPPFTALSVRWNSGYSRESGQMNKRMQAQARTSKSPVVEQRSRMEMMDGRAKDMLMPGTFIALPFNKLSWGDLPKYQWERCKNWAQNYFYRLSLSWASKPGIFKPAVLKYESRSQLVQTALSLQRDVNVAMASGDEAALRRLCGMVLYGSFAAALARRRPRETYSWERQQLHGSPAVVSSRLMQMPTDNGSLRQMVVVRIASTQVLGRVDPLSGSVIEDSKKVHRKSENLMMFRAIDSRSYEKGAWYLYGYLPDTTPEAWLQDAAHMEALQMQAVKQYKETRGKKAAAGR